MTLGDRLVTVDFADQLLGDGLEAVPGDLHARGEAHHRRLEHQFVGRLRLDQDDVDAGVAGLPALLQFVQALVGDELERLVADLGEAHVRDAARARAAECFHGAREVVDERHDRVDHDDQLRAGLDRDVEVGRGDDPAVDQFAVLHAHRRVDHRQGAGRAHGGRDRNVV
jgi:hypothetical protein